MSEAISNIERKKNKYGQYFTPEIIAGFMVELADLKKGAAILEPSCGRGIFLEVLNKKGYKNITAYEIDAALTTSINGVVNESFVSAEINDKFDLVIGNPPYIRWANMEDDLKNELLKNRLWNSYFNSLCDYSYIFILKSIELLKENGQLIFICPEYWLNTTHSITLRNYMVENGYFAEIYHFNETPIFDKVNVSIIIFKFVKSPSKSRFIKLTKYFYRQKLSPEILAGLKNQLPMNNVEYQDISHFKKNERWLLANDQLKDELETYESNCKPQNRLIYHTVSDFCDIGNGLVSGLDKAFQLNGHPQNINEKKAVINVVKAKDLKQYYCERVTKYLFVNDIQLENELFVNYPNFYEHLQPFKDDLEKRYQYSRHINYWEWVFLRNFNLFKKDAKRIFVPCKERISSKNYFRFALADEGIYPTQDVTAIFKKPNVKESIYYILALLNNDRTFNWLKMKGIVKGNIVEFSEKPIASIPFRAIDWDNNDDIELHNKISVTCKTFIETKNDGLLTRIDDSIDKLFK